jgi:hypothetical protein
MESVAGRSRTATTAEAAGKPRWERSRYSGASYRGRNPCDTRAGLQISMGRSVLHCADGRRGHQTGAAAAFASRLYQCLSDSCCSRWPRFISRFTWCTGPPEEPAARRSCPRPCAGMYPARPMPSHPLPLDLGHSGVDTSGGITCTPPSLVLRI